MQQKRKWDLILEAGREASCWWHVLRSFFFAWSLFDQGLKSLGPYLLLMGTLGKIWEIMLKDTMPHLILTSFAVCLSFRLLKKKNKSAARCNDGTYSKHTLQLAYELPFAGLFNKYNRGRQKYEASSVIIVRPCHGVLLRSCVFLFAYSTVPHTGRGLCLCNLRCFMGNHKVQ